MGLHITEDFCVTRFLDRRRTSARRSSRPRRPWVPARIRSRIASATAAFEIPAARLSVAYPEAGLAVLRRRLPHQTLARLFLLNERIPAAEAVAAGLVARVVEPGGALAAARVALGRLADLDPADVPPAFGAWAYLPKLKSVAYTGFWPNCMYIPAVVGNIAAWCHMRHRTARQVIARN